jgi:hypothetical protein
MAGMTASRGNLGPRLIGGPRAICSESDPHWPARMMPCVNGFTSWALRAPGLVARATRRRFKTRMVVAFNVVVVGSLVGGIAGGWVLWQTSDWTGAWIIFAAAFGVAPLGALFKRRSRSARVHRWGGRGIWLAYAALGMALALGLPDRAYEGIGGSILSGAAIDLWCRQGDRVKPLFYRLFGGPDPPQTDPVWPSRHRTASAPRSSATSPNLVSGGLPTGTRAIVPSRSPRPRRAL